MNHIRRTLLAVLLAVAPAAAANARPAPEQHMVQVGPAKLHLVVHRGSGPVILLESGAGLDATEWNATIAALAARTKATIVAYDRAGMGTSEPLLTPYDIQEESSRLHRALYALGLQRPLLLVGHSYGGFLVQLYANLHPADTIGLVYVDANTVDGIGGPDGAAKLGEASLAAARERGLAGTDVRLLQGLRATAETMQRYPAPCGIPVLVLTQGRTAAGPVPEFLRGWRAGHEALAAATGGELRVADNAGHMIPTERPDIVAEAILATLHKAGPKPPVLRFPAPGARCAG